MTTSIRVLLPALGLILLAGAAFGQTWKASCTNVGPASTEPLGPDGHALTVVTASCTIEGGPLNGGVGTQNVIWESAKGTSTLLSGDGVARKVGGTAAYRLTGGTLTPTLKDGQPAGWTASGTAVFTMGVGEAAALKGKSFTWTSKMSAPRQYVTENKMD